MTENISQKISEFDLPTLAEHASISGAYDRAHPIAFSSERILELLTKYRSVVGEEILLAYQYGLSGSRKDKPKQHIFMEVIEMLEQEEKKEI